MILLLLIFFKCRLINGIPTLGGEELERCSKENYQEVRKVNIYDLDSIDILARDMIMKAFNYLRQIIKTLEEKINIGIDMDSTICSTSEKILEYQKKVYKTRKNKQ